MHRLLCCFLIHVVVITRNMMCCILITKQNSKVLFVVLPRIKVPQTDRHWSTCQWSRVIFQILYRIIVQQYLSRVFQEYFNTSLKFVIYDLDNDGLGLGWPKYSPVSIIQQPHKKLCIVFSRSNHQHFVHFLICFISWKSMTLLYIFYSFQDRPWITPTSVTAMFLCTGPFHNSWMVNCWLSVVDTSPLRLKTVATYISSISTNSPPMTEANRTWSGNL